jgi:hypothetical protein
MNLQNVHSLPTNEEIKVFFYKKIKYKRRDLVREVLQTLKECVDELLTPVANIVEDLESPRPVSGYADDFDDTWESINNAYNALVACACEVRHVDDVHETALQLATKLKQEELHNCYSLNILIPGANSVCSNEVHFLITEKLRLVNPHTCGMSYTQHNHTNACI